MKLLITGCRGFVGGSVGRWAARAGHTVLGIARSSQPEPDWPGEYVSADVMHSDLSGTVRAFAPDAVLHAAGTASVGASLSAPLDDLRAAVLTWANTLEGIRRSGMQPRILFPSSAAVYGNPAALPIAEDAPVVPVSPYGFHKAACELVAQEYAACFGMDIILCRLFSVFGPAQKRLLVWELFQQCQSATPYVQIKGTGLETRDYMHMDDVSAVLLGLASVSRRGVGNCEAVNIASGQEMPILNVAEQMRVLVAPHKTVHCQGTARPGDPVRWQADVCKLRHWLPAAPCRPLSVTLPECVSVWQQETHQSL